MKNTYLDLIKQSYQFPKAGFDLVDGMLAFHKIPLKYLIDKYGTPFKLIYLPNIVEQIKKARHLFNQSFKKHNYKGKYCYAYCTKCNHYAQVIHTVLKENVQLETSSSFDIDIILKLYKDGKLSKKTTIIHNGYKTDAYLKKIIQLNKTGFENSITVLDSISEIKRLKQHTSSLVEKLKIGIRIAIDEEPQSAYHTSRLGIRPSEITAFYQTEIKNNDKVSLKMVHFFIDSGIKDNLYYWGEFQKALKLFVQLKQQCNAIEALNLGGGFPIRNNLGFEYDYAYVVSEIVSNIKMVCETANIEQPDIFTEFGKYTVGESGAIIFEVLEQKRQNDTETWYIINNSLLNTVPDAWTQLEKFILLPINKWQKPYTKVNIGGISCDHTDYYNSEDFNQQLFLPKYDRSETEPLYVGFFHTGAYQDAVSGYGGVKHCLIPSPKLIIADKDENGKLIDFMLHKEQSVHEMLDILGYH